MSDNTLLSDKGKRLISFLASSAHSGSAKNAWDAEQRLRKYVTSLERRIKELEEVVEKVSNGDDFS